MSAVPDLFVRWALAARSSPVFRWLEARARRLGYVDRLARRAYAAFRGDALARLSADPEIEAAMLEGGALTDGFGRGMEERVVEYPWVLARLRPEGRLLDAGSTFNFPWVLDHPRVRGRDVVIFTLAREQVLERRQVSYVYGDLRATRFDDEAFDDIVSISTLEHIGMDNRAYTGDPGDVENDREAYLEAVLELRRVLRPGGSLLVTVPFGEARDLGWLQVFDGQRLDALVQAFGGRVAARDFFRHDPRRGWQRVRQEEAAGAVYAQRSSRGAAVMAEAVACLHLVRE